LVVLRTASVRLRALGLRVHSRRSQRKKALLHLQKPQSIPESHREETLTASPKLIAKESTNGSNKLFTPRPLRTAAVTNVTAVVAPANVPMVVGEINSEGSDILVV
jgi:hypothetical protein